MSQPALRRVDPFARRVSPAEPGYVAAIPDTPSHRAIPYPRIQGSWTVDGAYPFPTMSISVVGRQTELQGIGTFLESINGGPRALMLYGEAGIGKTTLWQEGTANTNCRWARSQGQRLRKTQRRVECSVARQSSRLHQLARVRGQPKAPA